MQPNIKKIAWIVGGIIVLLIILGIIFSDSSTATVTLETPSSPSQLAQTNSVPTMPSSGGTTNITVGPIIGGTVQIINGGKTIVGGIFKGLGNFGRKIIGTNSAAIK